MRQFVKLSPTFWIGTTGKELSKAGPTAQLVALYFISSPHTNYCGIYRVSLAYASADLGLSQASLLKAIDKVQATGFLKFDPAFNVVWVVEAARWQIGDYLAKTDNRVKAIQSEFNTLPRGCPLRAEFYAKYAKAFWLTDSSITPPNVHRSGAKPWRPAPQCDEEFEAPLEI